jgi:hypothetical protein
MAEREVEYTEFAGGHVIGWGSAGSPGSDGASPYLSRSSPRRPALRPTPRNRSNRSRTGCRAAVTIERQRQWKAIEDERTMIDGAEEPFGVVAQYGAALQNGK